MLEWPKIAKVANLSFTVSWDQRWPNKWRFAVKWFTFMLLDYQMKVCTSSSSRSQAWSEDAFDYIRYFPYSFFHSHDRHQNHRQPASLENRSFIQPTCMTFVKIYICHNESILNENMHAQK